MPNLSATSGAYTFTVRSFTDDAPLSFWERALVAIGSRRLRAPRSQFRTHMMGGTWGDRLEWCSDTENSRGKIVGWKTPKPIVGDLLLAPLQSGRIGAFVIQSIEPTEGVHDMFFADVYRYGDAVQAGGGKP